MANELLHRVQKIKLDGIVRANNGQQCWYSVYTNGICKISLDCKTPKVKIIFTSYTL